MKLIFLVEWALYILFLFVRGQLVNWRMVLVALYPLLFFYTIASILTSLRAINAMIARKGQLLALSLGVVLVDQVLKWLVSIFIPVKTSIPILENWLHVTHERNTRGSWFLTIVKLNWISTGVLISAAVLVLLLAYFWYRYYTFTYRQTIWVDTAFIGVSSGLCSWLCDMVWRGAVVDYIHVPGVVAADVKDIVLTIGVAAFFAEAVENSEVSFRWKGWHIEYADLCDYASNLRAFIRSEISRRKDNWIGRTRK